jgi:hypothetical protein
MRKVPIWTIPSDENTAPEWSPYPSGVPIWTPPDEPRQLSYSWEDHNSNPSSYPARVPPRTTAPDITGTPTAKIVLDRLKAERAWEAATIQRNADYENYLEGLQGLYFGSRPPNLSNLTVQAMEKRARVEKMMEKTQAQRLMMEKYWKEKP